VDDEEVSAVASKAVASLDQWVSQADQILQEAYETALSPSLASTSEAFEREWTVSLRSFGLGLPGLLERLCSRPGRWILIAEDANRACRFWQAMAFEDGSLVTEAGSGTAKKRSERLTPDQELQLRDLKWCAPDLSFTPNWQRVEATTSPDITDVAKQALSTLRDVYGIDTRSRLLLRLFASPLRGRTPASEQVGDDLETM
jgi:hypothetical protein